jgi:hypothetical protein
MSFQFIQNMYGRRGSESYANRYVVCEFVMLIRQVIYYDIQIIVCEQLQIKILHANCSENCISKNNSQTMFMACPEQIYAIIK